MDIRPLLGAALIADGVIRSSPAARFLAAAFGGFAGFVGAFGLLRHALAGVPAAGWAIGVAFASAYWLVAAALLLAPRRRAAISA